MYAEPATIIYPITKRRPEYCHDVNKMEQFYFFAFQPHQHLHLTAGSRLICLTFLIHCNLIKFLFKLL